MANPGLTPEQMADAYHAYLAHGKNIGRAAAALGIPRSTMANRLHKYELSKSGKDRLPEYDFTTGDMTPREAWDQHRDTVERAITKTLRDRWRGIANPNGTGAFCIFHSTDEHLDDDKTPLYLIEADIRAAHNLNSIMCHGGDALNNWPMAGKLAKMWALQECTAPKALLRLEYFISIFKPNVWTNGNHEEMNPYLEDFIKKLLPDQSIQDYWTVNFIVKTEGGRDVRAVLSHKFAKGSSWFHKAHGHIREMLEGEEADLLMDGHLHSDGVLDHTLPERGHSSLCVASAGYKLLDKYAARISRGGKMPKLRGRAHWIVCDPQADMTENLCTAFKSPEQAEAYLNGLQTLRAV